MDRTGGSAAPTGTVTFLFTDIEGSTPLWDSYPDAMGPALARHDEMLRAAVDDHGGYVFSTGGDGVGAVFGRAADAVAAALEAQRMLAAEEWDGGPVIRVRMGLHTGEAEEREGDYFGPAVNRAARVMGAANGAQILVSDLTAGVVDQQSDVKLIDLGSVELKGMIEPVHVFGVAGEGHEWIDTPLLTGQLSSGNLPRLQTESVGDLADLQRRVANLARASVVTLTGSGGVGKTRAAIEIGWLVVDDFPDGVWMVELAPIADSELVATTIASALGARLQPGRTMVDSIVDWCFGRRMLLILDNCEHVIESVIEIVQAIVAGCPTVTVLATSREPLGLPGERVARIASLEERYAAELFVLRARSADASFEPTGADDEAIAAICRRLDGIPLAIELAAARIRSLSPAELNDRLDDRFRLLRGAGRGGLERHQTLRAAVAWSYQLLSDDAQLLFDRLSVFAGSFDLDAAEKVCADDAIDEFDVIDLLSDLVDKSMVTAVRTDGGTRYRLLETLRQYGEDRLDDRGETTALRDRHLGHYVGVSARLGLMWFSPEQARAGDLFDAEWENFGAVHGWGIATGSLEKIDVLIGSTGGFATSRLRRDHQEWTARTLDAADAVGEMCGQSLVAGGMWAFFDGEAERALALADQAAAEDPSLPMPDVVRVLAFMGSGRTDDAVAAASRLRELLPSLQDPVGRLWATFGIHQAYDPVHGDDDYEVALSLAREVGAPTTIAVVLRNSPVRWLVGRQQPDFDRVAADQEEAIRLQESVGASVSWEQLGRTWLAALLDAPEARTIARDALEQTYDERHWGALLGVLEVVPKLLAARSPQTAASALGFIDGSPPPWGAFGVTTRRQAEAAVAAIADLDEYRAAGAAMDRHEIVAAVLADLDD